MKRKLISAFLVLSLLVLIIVSCDPGKEYERQEQASIDAYLAKNPGLNFEKKPSGLYFLQTQAGTGRVAQQFDTAYVFYTMKFLTGEVIETNVGTTDTFKFPVEEGWVIAGFDEAITYMQKGTKALLIIPSKLGYGSTGVGPIYGYTPLLYDVQLVRIKPAPNSK